MVIRGRPSRGLGGYNRSTVTLLLFTFNSLEMSKYKGYATKTKTLTSNISFCFATNNG